MDTRELHCISPRAAPTLPTDRRALKLQANQSTPAAATPGGEEAAPRLSVVIPAYNETARIGRTIPALLTYLHGLDYAHELLIVDDGSTDGTPDMARQLLSGEPRARVLEELRNRGKGHAVRVGMLAAEGQFVLFCDADLSTLPEELDKFWPWLDSGYEVIIGSRKMAGANISRHQPLWRESLGKGFTWLTNVIAAPGISDVTCGFKCFSHQAAQTLFSLSIIDDWSFDAEVLFIAQRLGYLIKEVPVSWHDEPGTKVRLWKDTVRSLLGLATIRANFLRGRYKAQRRAMRKHT
jgi:glycosyltransferase involved in cell wall biosynthesis